MKSWKSALPYFSEKELACHHCGIIRLDIIFASALVAIRHIWGVPLTPTSVCRCPEHNKAVSGHRNSLHLTVNPLHETEGCAAIDINWLFWTIEDQLEFAKLAWSSGWSIGLSKMFIHLDARFFILKVGLPQHIFQYDNWHHPFISARIKESKDV